MSDSSRVAQALSRNHEKVFGDGARIALDREAMVRIRAFARTYAARHRQRGQHGGPLSHACMQVFEALLSFVNRTTGACYPSYEAIAKRANCARSTVAEALKALELAGVLGWQQRLTRIRERCQDLFGRDGWRWRVVRTSNAYVFHDPASKSGIRPGTRGKDSLPLVHGLPEHVTAALARLESHVASANQALNKAAAGDEPATTPIAAASIG